MFRKAAAESLSYPETLYQPTSHTRLLKGKSKQNNSSDTQKQSATMARPLSPAPTTAAAARKVLRTLTDLSSTHEITILKISEPIATAQGTNTNTGTGNALGRTSDISTASLDSPTPASLEADLAHYRELFAKLRFSYVEQVTKEKFIRAIVGDPPLIVTPQENAELEAENAAAKAALKALKTEVVEMVSDLEARGRRLAARHDTITLETAILSDLPSKIDELETQNADLRRAARLANGEEEEDEEDKDLHESQSGEGTGLNLPLAKTVALVEDRRARARELDRELEQLSSLVPRKRKEGERLRSETAVLETKRANSTAAAREARRRRENAQGGVEDDLEAKGRWYRATETALRLMLDVKE
ncbi:hypothetical protein B0T19DRAFT_411099 [Cercophora scortea]|uniref:Kinetochore protein Sos7 coiled-coil domain-containing protein n=1 Tax=Cercophora scortea TaxID=314031 RepID=A0AAE0J5K1_9PEZI|nr:hypothetical protein B0T19DRAFT_411099 [Cercophora scortea]